MLRASLGVRSRAGWNTACLDIADAQEGLAIAASLAHGLLSGRPWHSRRLVASRPSSLNRGSVLTRVPALRKGRNGPGHDTLAGERRGGARRPEIARAVRLFPRLRPPQGGGDPGPQARF